MGHFKFWQGKMRRCLLFFVLGIFAQASFGNEPEKDTKVGVKVGVKIDGPVGPPGWGKPGWGEPGWGQPGWGKPGWGKSGEPGWGKPGILPGPPANGKEPIEIAPG